MTRDNPTMSETMHEIEQNIESIERTWWRYGLPAVLLAWFGIGLALGVIIGVHLA